MYQSSEFMPKELEDVLKRQHYALAGHSAVKLCHYTKASIKKEKVCYKQQFYGIQSHRCLQVTPAVVFCNQSCIFCWRPLTGVKSDFSKYDQPEEIVEKSLELQRRLLSGLGGIKSRIDLKKYEEAQQPNNVAISLSGEPTLYPEISGLIDAYKDRGFSTFLVSNGSRPKVLESMSLPTQLYVSLEAPNLELHQKINAPREKDSWEKLNQSLELLSSLKTRKCIRVTCIKGLNMDEKSAQDFALLLKKTRADFVEVKGYSWVGFSRHRLKEENMPSHAEVKEFAKKINKHLNYNLVDEFIDARVFLLWNNKTPLKIKQKQKVG